MKNPKTKPAVMKKKTRNSAAAIEEKLQPAEQSKQQSEPVTVQSQLIAQEYKENEEVRDRKRNPKEIAAVMREIAEAVSEWIEGSSFRMLASDAGQIVIPFARESVNPKGFAYDHNLMNAEKMRWYAVLDPRFPLLINRRGERLELLDTIETQDEHVQFAIDEMHDFTNELAFCFEELGFYLGVFVGR